MVTKIGINGFGRIGRQVLKAITDRHGDSLQVVAINGKPKFAPDGAFLGEARQSVSDIALRKSCCCVDLSGQKPFAKWAKAHEADSKFLERRDDVFFRFSCEHGIFTLKRCN